MMDVKLELRVQGLDCMDEVAVLKRELGPLVGGEDRMAFDVIKGKMSVKVKEGEVSYDALIQAAAKSGFKAMRWQRQAAKEDVPFLERHGRLLFTCASGGCLFVGFLHHAILHGSFFEAFASGEAAEGHVFPLTTISLYLLAMGFGSWYVAPKAWLAARRLRPDMNLLMLIAVVGAVAIGEWFEAGAVAFLFSLSLTLEAWSVGRARRAVEALLDLTPATARVIRNDGELEVRPEDVEVGARILVKPGEKIPVDGQVLSGASGVNQAPITGESQPQLKEPGATVFAGSINGDGALELRCSKASADTTLARIIGMVEDAQSRRAPSEMWVETFAKVYTPVVMALSALVLLVPTLIFAEDWSTWIYRALVLLVIACPCALVISTPVCIVVALARSATAGVLIKGGLYVEKPARLRAIAFDKTGTLTRGEPSVVEVIPLNGHDEKELLRRVGALEARSEHPIARAVLDYAAAQGVEITPCEDYVAIKGKGASGTVAGKAFWLGSHRFLEERGQETPRIHERLRALSREGRTVVVVGNDTHVCGFIAVADAIRKEARSALERLRSAGIEHLVMLTGDNEGTARKVGEEIGIDAIRAELLPEDKVSAIAELVERFGEVAMVGDGVNDAPAMARASLGLAMGAAGTDAALETADIALMSDDLSRLPWLILHSRRTLAVIRQNIIFSLALKLAFVVMTLFGHASLWAAIAADMGASLLVIFNALRLLRPGDLAVERPDQQGHTCP